MASVDLARGAPPCDRHDRIGGKSNTGEGARGRPFKPLPTVIHALAISSRLGRFGVTNEIWSTPTYADQDAQGASREGGQLPAKGRRHIARGGTRPPRLYDFAASESRPILDRDLEQPLRPEESQPGWRRGGQLVSESASARARRRLKARADHVTIAGFEGGPRLSAHLDQARRLPVGDRARRDAPDAGGEPPARPHRRAGRRRHPHRARRRDRRDARRRRVRLLDRAADRRRLHHDARVPPQHLPGGRGAQTRCAQALRTQP